MTIHVDTGLGVPEGVLGPADTLVALGLWCPNVEGADHVVFADPPPIPQWEVEQYLDGVASALADSLSPPRSTAFWEMAVGYAALRHLWDMHRIRYHLEELAAVHARIDADSDLVLWHGAPESRSLGHPRKRSSQVLSQTVGLAGWPNGGLGSTLVSLRPLPHLGMDRGGGDAGIGARIRRNALAGLRRMIPICRTIWVDVIGMNPLQRLMLSIRLRHAALPIQRFRFGVPDGEHTLLRKQPQGLEEVFGNLALTMPSQSTAQSTRSLGWGLPRELLADWPAVDQSLRQLKTPHCVVFYGGFQAVHLAAAVAVDTGAALLAAQHGGNYGELMPSPSEIFERRVSRNFLTWGWRESTNEVAMPAFRLDRFARRYRRASARVDGPPHKRPILVLAPASMGPLRASGLLVQLIKGLSGGPWEDSQVVLRQHPKRNAPQWQREMQAKLGSRMILEAPDQQPVERSIAQSRLVVIPGLGSTGFLECLTVDHPVVIVAPPPLDVRQDYEMYLDTLRASSVVATNTHEIQTLLSALATADSWWNRSDVVAARHLYRANFAHEPSRPLRPWVKYLGSQLNGADRPNGA